MSTDYESDASFLLRTLQSIYDYSKNKNPRDELPKSVQSEILSTVERLLFYFAKLDRSPSAEYSLRVARNSLSHKTLTFGELTEIIPVVLSSIAYRGPTETRLERRIDEIKEELARLRSNPALEKKVAKLEEEVRKVRVASVVSENEGKEQEDIFKKYKAAEKKVFIIMPFAPVFDDVWKGGIERASNSEGFCCLRVDKISLSTWITEDIEKCIDMADVVISDITGNNPNVMFELGWALAKGKKPIVIRQQDDPNQVPFDVHGIRYIPYINSWSGVESLFKQISKFIKSTSETLGEKPTEDKSRKKKNKS